MLSIALIDDHAVFREGLKALLSTQADLRVVGEAGDAREGYEIVARTHPDVVLVDVNLPGVDGFSATRELKLRTRARVLVLSMFETEWYAARALAAGAAGYALKSQSSAEVLAALRAVGRGQRYLPPQFGRAALEQASAAGEGQIAGLSEREREVFDLVVRGFSNADVARELCISPKTVETHRMHVHKKLGVHSTASLVRFAALHGLLR
jgi:two-component system response regulator NreC